MTVATAAVAVLPGIKMSCEEMGALRERLTCRTTRRLSNAKKLMSSISWRCVSIWILVIGCCNWIREYIYM